MGPKAPKPQGPSHLLPSLHGLRKGRQGQAQGDACAQSTRLARGTARGTTCVSGNCGKVNGRGDGSFVDFYMWKLCWFRRIEIPVPHLRKRKQLQWRDVAQERRYPITFRAVPLCLPLVALQDSAYAKCLLRHLARHGHCGKVLLPWGLSTKATDNLSTTFNFPKRPSVCLKMGSLQFIAIEIGKMMIDL